MKVWRCEQHQAESVGTILDRPHTQCWKAWANKYDACRMVEMQLVPADTRVVSGLSYESMIAIMWRHLRSFVGAEFMDRFDGAVQACAEEIVDSVSDSTKAAP